MPIYEHSCRYHGVFEVYKPLRLLRRYMKCPKCGHNSPLIFSKPGKHIVDFTAGWNGGAGKYFDTKKQRETWMRENNAARA